LQRRNETATIDSIQEAKPFQFRFGEMDHFPDMVIGSLATPEIDIFSIIIFMWQQILDGKIICRYRITVA
jgi:hypothetical protein